MRWSRRIVVQVGGDATLVARRDGGAAAEGRLQLDDTSERLVRVFTRWLVERRGGWRRDELEAFGSLLHRILFPRPVWSLVDATAAGLGAGEGLRLQLSFSSTAPRHLAALPWEYLYVPQGPGTVQGTFLATDRRVLLSRHLAGVGGGTPTPLETLDVLVAVSQPDDLPEVVPEPVLEALARFDGHPRLRVTVMAEPPTPDALARELRRVRPAMFHFIGHGDYDEQTGVGTVALLDVDRTAKMLTGRALSDLWHRAGVTPQVVLLESCHGATTDARGTFAGTAGELVRAGSQCVVAMQYAVSPETAGAFTTSFYEALAEGMPVDEAAQQGRWFVAGALAADQDPRLLGIPVVYLQGGATVLAPPPPGPLTAPALGPAGGSR